MSGIGGDTEAAARTGRPRRIKVIDGRLQYRIIAIALTIVVAGLLLFAGLTVLFLLLAGPGRGMPSRELLLQVLPPLLLNDIAIMALIIVVGIVATNRIAGPVYRIQRDIDEALSGARGVRVRLRGQDAFGELAEKVNQLLERVDQKG
jgi:hypothetical protein